MSDRVAGTKGRAFPRLALAGLGLIFLSGCSSDVTRFSQSDSPFSNPFASNTKHAAPTPGVGASPLAQGAAPTTSGTRTASLSKPQAVGGSAAGWTAAGGSPIVVANGETLDTISGRYGVPASALLAANGLSSASEVKSGMHIVVPVYHADDHAVANAEKEKAARKRDVADAEPKSAKSKAKDKEKETASAKADKAAKEAQKSASKNAKESKGAAVAEAEPSKSSEAKKPAIDKTPTGKLESGASQSKTPLTGAQADAAGTEPEFRWPARGRIIQGFKAGGNDGINISVPSGTSVRAAESGVVVYSGDGLKGYGNLVLIKHPNGFVTAYGNNGELDVKRGEQVKRGQVIAKSGDTGNVNSPQLHFELRKGSTPVDPTSYLAGL
ncbi:MAG TPA: M23 family metallopeptidase [Roseiarcus sp.]|jgi:murein DD-endopeptidase MepM/ murein hydrolase activator NlpD